MRGTGSVRRSDERANPVQRGGGDFRGLDELAEEPFSENAVARQMFLFGNVAWKLGDQSVMSIADHKYRSALIGRAEQPTPPAPPNPDEGRLLRFPNPPAPA